MTSPAASGARPVAPARKRSARSPMALDGALWLQQGGSALGGADRVALLEAIRDTGSMTRAAKAVGISYKTAWDRVQDMHNVAAKPLVLRSAGGAGGGGTRLTPYALELIAGFRQVEQEHGRMLARLSKSMAEPRGVLQSLAVFSLRTSARNQLAGRISAVQPGAVNAVVELALHGADDRLQVSLTMGSLQRLGIEVGMNAVALIKAPSVFLAQGDDGARLSVANQLQATVTRIERGAVNAEVQARLAGGQVMVAMVSLGGLAALALQPGAAVRVLFAETSVILGVP